MKTIAVSHDRISIAGKVRFESIISFTMKQIAGEHGVACLRGVLTEEGSRALAGRLSGESITVSDRGADASLPLFEGFISETLFSTENGLDIAEFRLMAGSALLDVEKKSRSYQDVRLTYDEVIKDVLSDFEDGAFLIAPELRGKEIGTPVIRYSETAWEFIRRLASRGNLPVFSDVRSSEPRVYVGLPIPLGTVSFSEDIYAVSIGREYYLDGGAEAGLEKKDFLRYDIEDGAGYFLGSGTTFKGHSFQICGKSCALDNGLLVYKYLLADRKFCYTRRRYNPCFAGMSLLGSVLATEKAEVRVKLDIDEAQDVGAAFPWPWTPETGNLMYLMPQVGTKVSIYFGDDDEAGGLAIHCVRTNAPATPPRGAATKAQASRVSAEQEGFPPQQIPQELPLALGQALRPQITPLLYPSPGGPTGLQTLPPLPTAPFPSPSPSGLTAQQALPPLPAAPEGLPPDTTGEINEGVEEFLPNHKVLSTEHGKYIFLYPDKLGLNTAPGGRLWVEDGQGLQFVTPHSVNIIAAGKISITGKNVSIRSELITDVLMGAFKEDGAVDSKALVHMEKNGDIGFIKTQVEKTIYSALSVHAHPFFEDDPEIGKINHGKIWKNAAGAIVIVIVIGVATGGVGYIVAGALGAAGAASTCIAISLGSTVVVTGGLMIAGQVASDYQNGAASDFEEYLSAAILGSIIGIINGVAGLVPVVGHSLVATVAAAFGSGAGVSILADLWNGGEIDWEKALKTGGYSMLSSLIMYSINKYICFVAGTPVLTACGIVAIEDIKAGDMVYSEERGTGEKGLKKVLRTFVNHTKELSHVCFGGGMVSCTPGHPFYVAGKGWVNAKALGSGDGLVLRSGDTAAVESVRLEALDEPVAVYNFEVEDWHTYYVGSDGVLVHNLCDDVDDLLRSNSDDALDGAAKVTRVKPSLQDGGKPRGRYELPDPEDLSPITRQNEAADLFAAKGYDIEMLPNKDGGNGYGIKPRSNPDWLIENQVFDCYTPKADTPIKNISYSIKDKTVTQTKNIVVNLDDSPFTTNDIIANLKDYPINSLDCLLVVKNGNIYQAYP